jgi:hypothetical protein
LPGCDHRPRDESPFSREPLAGWDIKLPVEVQVEVLPRVQGATRDKTRAIVAEGRSKPRASSRGGNGTDEKAVERLARLLGELGPLLERTNKLMFNILTTAGRAGVTEIGGVGSLRTGMELNDLRANLKKFDETFG